MTDSEDTVDMTSAEAANVWRGQIVTPEGQERMLEEVLLIYRRMGVPVEVSRKEVPLHSLIATQDGIEAEKLPVVRAKVAAGELDIPVIVEEHFVDDRDVRYLIDGHCRVRALIELGHRTTPAYVIWSPAGEFRSNFVTAAATYGNVPVKDLPLV